MDGGFLFILLAGLICSITAEHPTHCPDDWTQLVNSCYAVFDSLSVSWEDAQGYCDAFGSDLVAIETDVESQNVINMMNSRTPGDTGKYWIDANDILVEGKWRYHGRDGNIVTYTNWAAGHPVQSRNVGCATLDMLVHAWVDQPCTGQARFICEIHLSSHNSDMVG